VRESKTLKEYGMASYAGFDFDQTQNPAMVTPRGSLAQVASDWQQGGVMLYDVPMNTNDMRYHVMMPVEELWPYISRTYRGDMHTFRGQYESFIRDGPRLPVYVAIGENAIKVTGNEDLVWFAKKSGLKDVPVFISYQKQV
jgi:hypothetical protein